MTESSGKVAGVLLAGGLSVRLGQPKPLALLGGEPLCRYAARAMSGANYDALLAVIPPGTVGAAVQAALAEWPFEYAVNPEPQRGMLSSFKEAVRALPRGLAGASFVLADMPRLTSQEHRALLQAFAQRRPPLVLAQYGAALEGVQAPPILLRADLWPELLQLPDRDHGPRALLKKYAAHAEVIALPPALLLDLDTPEALAEAQSCFGQDR